MKNNKLTFKNYLLITILLFIGLSIPLQINAQVPQKMNYQAVVRDASDNLIVNQAVGLQLSILQGSASGTAVYVETHNTTTSSNGVINLEIGTGTVVLGTFSTIDWGNFSHYFKTETDATGGTTYTITSTSQLLSVPYALYAKDTDNTLDQSYNQEQVTLPIPRIIEVDDGQIEMNATDHVALVINGDSGLKKALIVNATGDGTAVEVNKTGAVGIGLKVSTTSVANASNTLEVVNNGTGNAIKVLETSTGDAVYIDNLAGGGGKSLLIDQFGVGDAVDINNTGTGKGVNIANTNGASVSEALFVSQSATKRAVFVNNLGTAKGVEILNANLAGVGEGLLVRQNGTADAVKIWNANALNAKRGLYVDNDGTGDATHIDNLAGLGGRALFVEQAGAGDATHIKNLAGVGRALFIEQAGIADALVINNAGTGKAMNINNTGAGMGLLVNNAFVGGVAIAAKIIQKSDKQAMLIDNFGTDKGLEINNLNAVGVKEALNVVQLGTGKAMIVDNSGTAEAVLIQTLNPLNVKNVLDVETLGTGIVAHLSTANNNLNSAPTLEAVNRGSGSVANFITFDELVGKVNVSPTVNIISNGKGAGLNVNIINVEGAGDANTEPAIFALHEGEGQIAHFENTFIAENHAVEIINKGAGNGLHIDNFDHGSGTDNALHVEQSNLSFIPSKGYAALFELHEASGFVDSTVKITSAATSLSHSALRVHASSIANLAATFEGDVHISSDLTIGTSLMVPTATFTSLTTNGSGTIGALTATSAIIQDLTVTGSISAPAKAFKIDHPLDEENKFLFHNSIESNERLNVYSGNVNTDNDGFATVTLPDYMSALNADFRYQLTILDKTFAQAIIWEEFNNNTNTFTIKTNQPNIKVSWQLTGTRIDKWAKDHPLQVEVLKEKIK